MRIKTSYLLLFISVILNTKLFGMIGVTPILSSLNFFIILILLLTSFKRMDASSSSKYLWLYLIYVFIFVLVFQYISECVVRRIPIQTYFSSSNTYLYLLLVIPIYNLFCKEGHEKLFLGIYKIALTVLLCSCAAYILFSLNIGDGLFEYFKSVQTYRDNRIRLTDITNLWPVYICVLYVYAINEKKVSKIKKSMLIIITLFVLVVIQQTRMNMMICVGSFLFSWFFTSKKNSKKRILQYVLLGVITLVFISVGWLDLILSSFSLTGNKATSSLMRILELQYAINEFTKNPLLGYGISKQVISNAIDLVYLQYIFKEPYSHVDVGIIGSTAMLGIPFWGVYFIPMIRYGKCFAKIISIESKLEKRDVLFISLYIYILLGSFTLLITDAARIYLWPFILAFFEYEYKIVSNHTFVK